MVETGTYERRGGDEIGPLARRWWLLVALGVLVALIGLAALGATVVATVSTVVFLGAALLAAGVIDVVSALSSRRWHGFGLHLVTGILAGVFGGLLMAYPLQGAAALTLMLAMLLMVSGIARILYSLSVRFRSWGWALASGVAAVLLGAMVLAEFPTSALWFLGVVVGVELLFRGMMWIILGMAVHRAPTVAGPPSTLIQAPT